MRRALASFLAEPPAPGAPTRTRWDLPVLAVAAVVMVGEVTLRPDLPWRGGQLVLGLWVLAALRWRRRHPAVVTWATFGVVFVVDTVSRLAVGNAGYELYASVVVMLAPWTLVRWGSGRQIVRGMPPVLVAAVSAIVWDTADVGEALAGFVFFVGFLEAAWLVRARAVNRRREVDDVRRAERDHLARELHDTVAHHVSAIVVQAQAGQAVAGSSPERAAATLPVIEEAARRALADMRDTVGLLRSGDAPVAPRYGVADLVALRSAAGPPLEVTISGAVDGLPSALDAGVYRLVREAVTNAQRHARDASVVRVDVVADDDGVTVEVVDDGRPVARGEDGFGLEGMRERARLLGGSFDAGPLPTRGWRVHARLPLVPTP